MSLFSRLASAGRTAIGLDPVAAASTQCVDDLSDRARLRALIARETITHIIHAGGVSGPMVLADDPAGSFGRKASNQGFGRI